MQLCGRAFLSVVRVERYTLCHMHFTIRFTGLRSLDWVFFLLRFRRSDSSSFVHRLHLFITILNAMVGGDHHVCDACVSGCKDLCVRVCDD